MRYQHLVVSMLAFAAIAGCVRRESNTPVRSGNSQASTNSTMELKPRPELERWTQNEDGSSVLEEWYENGKKKCIVHYSDLGLIEDIIYWDRDGYVTSEWRGPLRIVVPLRTESDDEVADHLNSWIEGVYLRGNKNVTAKVFAHFTECEQLKWIDVRECPGISQADVNAYRLKHPQVRVKTARDTEHP